MAPRVSVVVTTYNQARYIAATIRGVLHQTFRDYEIVVVDDGSTDETLQEVRQFGSQLRAYRQPNQGVASSRNAGVRLAAGHFVAFLDGDDTWEPNKLELQVKAIEAYPDCGLVAVDGVQFSQDRILYDSLYPDELRAQFQCDAPLVLSCYERFLRRNFISTTSQVLIPRTVLDIIGPADRSLPVGSDWDMYIRVAATHKITFLPEKLVHWRYLPTSASGPALIRPLRWASDHLAILRKHERFAQAEYRSFIRALRAQKLRETAEATYWYGRQADAVWARQHLLTLARSHPMSIVPVTFLFALCLPRPIAHHTGLLARFLRRLLSREQRRRLPR
jgi:glycosyltransferase involved in cell wall biosynthesis